MTYVIRRTIVVGLLTLAGTQCATGESRARLRCQEQ